MEKETVITGILLIVSFSAYASMAKLLFHFRQSIFKNLNIYFWYPVYSSANKWKNGSKEEGEEFLFSSTLLVFLTDGYHLMQFIFENSLFLAFSINREDFKWYWGFIIIRILYGVVFNLMFDKVLIKK